MAPYCHCTLIPSSDLLIRAFHFPSPSGKRRICATGSRSSRSDRVSFKLGCYSSSLLNSASGSVSLEYANGGAVLRRRRTRGVHSYPPQQVLAFVQNSIDEWDGAKLETEAEGFHQKPIHGSSQVSVLRRDALEQKETCTHPVEVIRTSHYGNRSLDCSTVPSLREMPDLGFVDHTESGPAEVLKEGLLNSVQMVHIQSVDEVNSLNTKMDSEMYYTEESGNENLDGKMGLARARQANSLVHLPGSRRVVELLTAWDSLAERLSPETLRSKDCQLLTTALKLAIIAFKDASFSNDQRLPLARALAVAYLLADFHMDARVIAAGLLREVVEAGMVSMTVVQNHLGSEVVHLIHDCLRVKKMSLRVHSLDEDTASLLRKFSLTFHDIRAVIVEVTARLDTLRHITSVPKYQQQILALEAMQIYAPLAHALGIGKMSLELEDISFRVLFPDSYAFVQNWMATNWKDGDGVIGRCQKVLQEALKNDAELQGLVESVEVLGRVKSRFSTMKKLLKDGRSLEEIYDILGLRVILIPKSGDGALEEREMGAKACYRALKIVTKIWKEVPGRMKDYIAQPKKNGYESLHLSVYLSNHGMRSFPVELQIRTAAMHALAVEGTASHAFYKGGLTDPQQARQLKEIMLAAASAAASRFQDNSGDLSVTACELRTEERDHLFTLFDRNKDGVISMEEFQVAIGELGAERDDAHELMQLVDSNIDGCISAKEFQNFLLQLRTSENGGS